MKELILGPGVFTVFDKTDHVGSENTPSIEGKEKHWLKEPLDSGVHMLSSFQNHIIPNMKTEPKCYWQKKMQKLSDEGFKCLFSKSP
eukprot:391664-Pelagomonas_calceolata.AAC.1